MTAERRHVVITGGGTGIGAAISRAIYNAGHHITVMGRRQQPLDELVSTLSAAQDEPRGPSALAVSCDVSDPASVAQSFAQAVAENGPINILINAAGAAPTAPFHKMTSEQWQQVLAVNLNGVFNTTQAVIPDMLESGWGRVINIASTASLKGYAYVSAYCAAKHGVLGLTRALALEVANKGITVNAICPGYTDTDIIRDAVKGIVDKTGRSEAEALGHFSSVNPQKRLIQPEEIAATTLWLCSDGAVGVNGQAIAIDGGESAG